MVLIVSVDGDHFIKQHERIGLFHGEALFCLRYELNSYILFKLILALKG
jgi:hypothetical protein